MNIKRSLGFGCLGSGVSVFDRLHEKNGDFERVAHIGPDRKIKYYAELSETDALEVEEFARFEDPRASHTQEQKVFIKRPEPRHDTNKTNKARF